MLIDMILLIDKAIQYNWSLYTGETKTNPDTVGKTLHVSEVVDHPEEDHTPGRLTAKPHSKEGWHT